MCGDDTGFSDYGLNGVRRAEDQRLKSSVVPSLTSTDKSVCATLRLVVKGEPVWHRHSCLCFGKVQFLVLITRCHGQPGTFRERLIQMRRQPPWKPIAILMNRYIFGYRSPPLRNLHAEFAGKQLKQSGIIHKIVDIPFTMFADVSVSNGLLRIHPTKLDICGINGLGLLKAVDMTMQKMLKLPKERGISAQGNDLLLDPNLALPPPKVELNLVAVRVEGNELVQVFDAGRPMPVLC